MNTYTVRVYMAGPIDAAKAVLRKVCYLESLCVTVEPTTFIYTGGEEDGVVVGFVDYPKHPSTRGDVYARARRVALAMMPELNQKTALLVATDKTERLELLPPGTSQGQGEPAAGADPR